MGPVNSVPGWFLAKISSLPKIALFGVTMLMVFVIFALDYLTGLELSFSVFYLIPALSATWFGGRNEGVVMCVVCACAWLLAETLELRSYSSMVVPYWNAVVRLTFFLICSFGLSKIKAYQLALIEIAREDPLTGVLNTRGFHELAGHELARARRRERPFTLAYIDLDNFKSINDELGHSEGDHLLKIVAGAIKKNIRQTDLLGRLGGDEFAVLLPETGPKLGERTIRRFHERASSVVQSKRFPVTMSIGGLNFANPPESLDEMIKEVDAVMYEAKHTGKNRVIFKVKDEPAQDHTRDKGDSA